MADEDKKKQGKMTQAAWDESDAVLWLAELSDDRALLSTMASAARQSAQPEAAATLVDDLEGMVKPGSGKAPNVAQGAE